MSPTTPYENSRVDASKEHQPIKTNAAPDLKTNAKEKSEVDKHCSTTSKRPKVRSLDAMLGVEARRWILFSFSFLCVSLVAGLVYGWPALRQQLLSDGSELTEKELGAIFTVGAWSTQGGRFITGLARDRYGTRIAACSCLVCTAGGSLGIALSNASNGAALGTSLFFVGIGSGTQLCVQPVAGLFPKHAGAVLSTLSGAFQVSGLIFLVLTNVSNSRRGSFLGFTFFLLGLTAVAALLLPSGGSFVLNDEDANVTRSSTDVKQESVVGDDTEEKGSSPENEGVHESEPDSAEIKDSEAIPIEAADNNSNDLEQVVDKNEQEQEDQHPTLWQQLRTREYLGLLIWFSVCIVPLQYYVATIGFQLEEKGDEGFYTDLFAITYASAAVVAPVGGYIADKCSLGIAHGLATTLTAASLFILASPASLNAQVVGLICYGVGRMLTFGMYFSNVGKRFGYRNYGTLAGLGLITSSIISLLQYPLIAWTVDGHDVAVNVSLGAMLLAVMPYCFWLHRQERRHGKAPHFKKNFMTGAATESSVDESEKP